MEKDVQFVTQDYSLLAVGPIEFLFIVNILAASEKLRTKACLWDKALRGNIHPLMDESS